MHPTIDNIDLPGKISRITKKYKTTSYADKLTNADRQALDEVDLFPYSF